MKTYLPGRPRRITATVLSLALGAAAAIAMTPAALAAEEPAPTQATVAGNLLQTASSGEVEGLRSIVADYRTRVPADYTVESWTSFAAARNAAESALARTDATTADLVAVKNALQSAAADLVTVSEGSFQPITNDTFWTDTDGNPIYSEGGGIFRFGDTYYWYGVHYQEADSYLADPAASFATSTFSSITVYSSKDLVDWTFENDIATRDTALDIPESAGSHFSKLTELGDASWIGRLGVSYNENTGKYVVIAQMNAPSPPTIGEEYSVLFLQGDSPTGDFEYGNLQRKIVNSPTWGTGDQTVFTDEDGQDYLVFSNSRGRANAFVSKIAASDSLSIEPATLISQNAAGREGNAMFRLNDTYYMAASDLHGWNTSVNYIVESESANIQGAYGSEYVLPGTEKDYSHVTQTGFFVTVHGTKQDTVLYAGDRWAAFAWNGIGYNQWLPITETDGELRFHSLSDWEFNAVTGEWRVGEGNNYILNPDFAADRVIVQDDVTGWTTLADEDSSATSFVGTISPGADSSRFALRLGAADAFAGSVSQTDEIPSGTYRLAATVMTDGGLESARLVVTGDGGEEYALDIAPATTGWQDVELDGLVLAGGSATVSIEARGDGGESSVAIDGLSLVAQDPVVDSVSVRTTRSAYAVGESFDSSSLVVQALLSDGSSTTLDPSQYAVEGFSSAQTGDFTASVSVSSDLIAAGSPPVSATFPFSVREAWDPDTPFVADREVVLDGALWHATWWTQGQRPGDPSGPWQQIVEENGVAVWTASRIFVSGERAEYDGVEYVARWWTRNQEPGDPAGPWAPVTDGS